jgi:hypothetical protein
VCIHLKTELSLLRLEIAAAAMVDLSEAYFHQDPARGPTIEPPVFPFRWQARRESNPQPAVLETAALPIELLA